MSTSKFFGESGGEHGAPLHWPGTAAGFPVRGGQPTDLKQTEFENLDHTFDFKAQSFRLWLPDELQAYLEVMDRIANGWYAQRFCERHWSEEHAAPVIWLEWLQIYGEITNGRRPPVTEPPQSGFPRMPAL